ncbi:vesicular glutamate transporter 1-like [Chrysoperla carnea]|uniref:vesicular glutamate transporter 1-like n=1 Tax=Chrysoperla carnea TaxID=189513 RepID=UPI001D065222|nr:vesicular glutamate transporter 1-like [Chrysoperla carnea]
MDLEKSPKDGNRRLSKLDKLTIVNKRFTLSFLMNIGLALMFFGIKLSLAYKCLMTSVDNPKEVNPSLYESSFRLSFILIAIPAAWLSLKFSPLTWFGRSILAHSILLFIIALFGHVHFGFLVVLKFLEGVIAGTAFILFHASWKNWTTAAERSTLITFALAGQYLGEIIADLTTKFCSEFLFWILLSGILGIFTIIWWILWESVVYETPNTHRSISEEEYNQIHPIIQEELRPTENVSCKQIIFSAPFLVLVIVHVFRSWSVRFYLYEINSLILIHIMKFISFPLSGYLADVLVRKTSLTRTHVRKLFITGVYSMECIYYLMLTNLHMDNWVWFLISFIMEILFNTSYSAACINAIDIAPSHAGVTVAITSIVSHGTFLLVFSMDRYLHEIDWYDMVNFIAIIGHLLAGIVYGIYGTANPITVKE